jgi:hypothetical protein
LVSYTKVTQINTFLKMVSFSKIAATAAVVAAVSVDAGIMHKFAELKAQQSGTWKNNWKCQVWSKDPKEGSLHVIDHLYEESEIQEQCKDFEHFTNGENITFAEIALAWRQAGMSVDACPAAMIVIGGEAQRVGQQVDTFTASGPSGVFQCDSCRGQGSNKQASCDANSPMIGEQCQLNLQNPCIGAWALVKTVMFPALGMGAAAQYNPGCFRADTPLNPSMIENACDPSKDNCDKCNNSPGDKTCGKYSDVYTGDLTAEDKAEMDCNFIGPFCHWQYSSGSQQPGGIGAWNGGNNGYQHQPFPQYYMNNFQDAHTNQHVCEGEDDWAKCANSHAPNKWADVWATAQKICDDAYSHGPTPPGPTPSKTTTTTAPGPQPKPETTTTTTPAPGPAPKPGQCVQPYAQCGGDGWTGPTTCCKATQKCVKQSHWFSGCSDSVADSNMHHHSAMSISAAGELSN